MMNIQILQNGIEQVNQAFIEQPEFDGNYPAMVVQYLISAFLINLGGKAEDFGFYTDPAVGYTGYIAMGDKVLFFAPTKAIILQRSEPGGAGEELSPYGVIP
jgi:hypothetical protein